ncbi:hypothetical protein J0H58_25655 [bacterium]|nr:hypothetical protein [bacterium]
MNRLSLTAVVAVAATLGAPAAARADFILDSFNSPSPGTLYFVSFSNTNPYTQIDKGIAPGVDRTVTVKVNEPPLNPTSANGTIGGGTLVVNSDTASSVTTELSYALSGAAGNLSGATGLQLGFLSFDVGTGFSTTPITIDIVTATGTLTTTMAAPGSTVPYNQSFAAGRRRRRRWTSRSTRFRCGRRRRRRRCCWPRSG